MRLALAAVVALAVAVAVAAPAYGQAPPVATVDGIGEVTRAQFDHWMLIAARADGRRRVPPAGTPAFRRIRRQVVELLVNELWVRGEAQQRGIVVTAEEVRRDLARQRRQSFPRPGDFGRFLRRSGYTLADLRFRVRLELLSNRVRDEVVRDVPAPTAEELRAYYDAHLREFAFPERRRLQLLTARSRAAAATARRLIARGASFARAARKVGAAARTLSRNERTLPSRLDRAVFRAPRRQVRGPVRVMGRWYVFRVVAVRPGGQQPFEEAEPTIREVLLIERRQQALDAFVADFQQRWHGVTTCRERYALARVCGRTVP